MGVRYASTQTVTLTNTTIVTTAETIVLTAGALNPTFDNGQVQVLWYGVVLVGTTCSSYTAKLRRGNAVTGTLINVSTNVTCVAGNIVAFSGCYFDSPGVVAEQQYVITLTMNAATANSTMVDGCLLTMVL